MPVFDDEETEMADAAKAAFRKYYPDRFYVREYRYGEAGTPGRYRVDAILFKLDYEAIRTRNARTGTVEGFSSGSGRMYLEILEEGGVHFDELMPDESVYESMEWEDYANLTEKGLVETDDSGWIEPVKVPRRYFTHAFAFELKRLCRAEKAIEQAKRSLDFAHKSWVVMDGDHIQAALNRRDVFNDTPGLGLMKLDKEGLEVLLDPFGRGREPPQRDWLGSGWLNDLAYEAAIKKMVEGETPEDVKEGGRGARYEQVDVL